MNIGNNKLNHLNGIPFSTDVIKGIDIYASIYDDDTHLFTLPKNGGINIVW